MSLRDRPALGILGGTFNPPHLGHLAVARHALQALSLQRVILMPANVPTHKRPGQDPGGEHRLEMCRLLVSGCDGLSVCALELERGGQSYTIETLRSIRASHPEALLTFIVGADIAGTLPRWREPAQILELADLAIAERGGAARERLLGQLAPLDCTDRIRFLEMPAVDISSSQVRAVLAAGGSVEELVGSGVAGYIAQYGLYRPTNEQASA